ncbi:MAG: FecR domain-containing protein [Burkholderiales bacterium]|nr:FecR domain-containing protein [Burkholderiales bacterium]
MERAGKDSRAGRAIRGRWAATLATAALVAFPAFEALAQARTKPEGMVVSIRDGTLERFRHERWTPLRVGQAVSRGDRVRTDRTAVATVTLDGIGRLVIGPSSDIELGKDRQNFRMRLQRGFAWFQSKLRRGSNAYITTSLATAGVRGTSFSVCYDGTNFCACTCAGEVNVAVPDGPAIDVGAGQYVAFAAAAPLPASTSPGATLLEKTGAGFDFCFNCHVVGGKGGLKQDRK